MKKNTLENTLSQHTFAMALFRTELDSRRSNLCLTNCGRGGFTITLQTLMDGCSVGCGSALHVNMMQL